MDRTIAGVFWILLYLAIVMAPVALMLVPPVPSGRAFWLELSVALGFVGLTQIGLQFVLIARFRRVTAPYGIDVIIRAHRQIAIVAVVAILIHPALVFVDEPARLALLNPLGGNWASRLGMLSVAALVITLSISLLRERLRLDYERWRYGHIALGVLAIVAAQAHASMAGLYINSAWKQAIWIAMAAVMVGLVVNLRLVAPALQKRARWRVAEITPERGETHVLALEPVGHEGLRFRPGQFAWVKLSASPFTLEEHPFSFSSSALRPERVEFGVKALGDFTRALGEIPAGTPAYLDGPHGAFSIDRYEAPGYLFFAGGAGISPFISVLRTMADRGDPRPVMLFYADRSLETLAFRDALEELEERLDLVVVYVLEEPGEEWQGERGFITEEVLDRHIPEEHFERDCMICGPPPMMDAVEEALLARGVPRGRIQLERFALV